ncbi:hypothetical protein ACTVBU_10825 [Sanguibacter sp. A246]
MSTSTHAAPTWYEREFGRLYRRTSHPIATEAHALREHPRVSDAEA